MDSELKQYLENFEAQFRQIGGRFERIDAQFQQVREENAAAHEETRRVLRGEMAEMSGTLRGEMAEMGGTLRGEMAEMSGTLRLEIAGAVSTLRGEAAAAHEETRSIVRQENSLTQIYVNSTVDRLQGQFGVLAEGIQNLDEKIDREAADIRAEMRQGFADTHALIRFSRAPRTRSAKR